MPRGISELEGCPVSYDTEAFHGMAPAAMGRAGNAAPRRPSLPLEVL